MKRSGGRKAKLFHWFAHHLDGPGFWSVVPSRPEAMRNPNYSTIVVELVRDTGANAESPPASRRMGGDR
jgi:hypothetical protein